MSEPIEIVAQYVNQSNQNPSCRIQNTRYADAIAKGKKPSIPKPMSEDNIMEDADFNKIKEEVAKGIFEFGLSNLRQYNYRIFGKFSLEVFRKDFVKLQNYKLVGNTISPTTKIGQKCMEYYTMPLIDRLKIQRYLFKTIYT